MIVERVRSGMVRAKEKGTKSGKSIGRPKLAEPIRAQIRLAYEAGGVGLRGVARQFNVSVETCAVAWPDRRRALDSS